MDGVVSLEAMHEVVLGVVFVIVDVDEELGVRTIVFDCAFAGWRDIEKLFETVELVAFFTLLCSEVSRLILGPVVA